MSITPEISIITPVYNGLPYLKECTDSVLKQNFRNWEMVISDDASVDGSRKYLATIDDPRIRIFEQDKNLGIFDNLNFLFEKALAPISQILCQDDYFIKENSVQIIHDYWQDKPEELGFTRFNYQIRSKADRMIPDVIEAGKGDLWFYLFGNLPGNLSNVSLRTRIVHEDRSFDQQFPYAGDFEFWSRVSKNVRFSIQKEKITHIRRHPGVASNYLNRNGELVSQKKDIVEQLYNRVIEKYPEHIFNLKFHGTIAFDALQRDTGIRWFMKGNKKYLNEVNRISSKAEYIFSKPWTWVIFIFSMGGRLFRNMHKCYLIKKIKKNT